MPKKANPSWTRKVEINLKKNSIYRTVYHKSIDVIWILYILYTFYTFFTYNQTTTKKYIILGFIKMDLTAQYVFVTTLDLKYAGPTGPLSGYGL